MDAGALVHEASHCHHLVVGWLWGCVPLGDGLHPAQACRLPPLAMVVPSWVSSCSFPSRVSPANLVRGVPPAPPALWYVCTRAQPSESLPGSFPLVWGGQDGSGKAPGVRDKGGHESGWEVMWLS